MVNPTSPRFRSGQAGEEVSATDLGLFLLKPKHKLLNRVTSNELVDNTLLALTNAVHSVSCLLLHCRVQTVQDSHSRVQRKTHVPHGSHQHAMCHKLHHTSNLGSTRKT